MTDKLIRKKPVYGTRILQIVITANLLFKKIKPQNNPACKAKRYMCATEELESAETCVQIVDEQEKYYHIRPCTDPVKSYCPFEEAQYGKPVNCTTPPETISNLIPGDKCNNGTDCLSGNCDNSKCKGKELGEICKKHEDCDVGYFCNVENQCQDQRGFDDSCRSDYECANNCVCNLGLCAYYYKFDNGVPADNPKVCKSGYIGEDGNCEPGLRSKHPGNPCSFDLDCEYINYNDTVVKTGTCTCGFNAGSFSYCPLETGDQEFKDVVRAIEYIKQRNAACHTLRRFGPCDDIYAEDYTDYHLKLQRYERYPIITMNDECVARIYTWEFWQYYFSSKILGLLPLAIFLLTSIV